MKMLILLLVGAMALEAPFPADESFLCRSCLEDNFRKICQYEGAPVCCDIQDYESPECASDCTYPSNSTERFLVCPSGESCGKTEFLLTEGSDDKKVKIKRDLHPMEVCIYSFGLHAHKSLLDLNLVKGNSSTMLSNVFYERNHRNET